MQILSDKGFENGEHNGLSVIEGNVSKIKTNKILPHVGWNSINIKFKNKLIEK